MANFLKVALIVAVVICGRALSKVITGSLDDDDSEVVEVVASNGIVDPVDIIDLSRFGGAIFGKPDNKATAIAVAKFTEDSLVNPEELGTYLEGDILVPNQLTRNGLTKKSTRWPNGIVPFEIRGDFNAQEMATIENAINEYHARTCIHFVYRTNEPDYISIVSGNSGCWSAIGKVGGKQEVNLQSPGCLTRQGTPIHELMHVLGFLHEQNRYERDHYVLINFHNIQTFAKTNFDKASPADTSGYGVPYDYNSVMHYSPNAFSKNGNPTIVALQSGASRMGQREGFSPLDVQKINTMYNCHNIDGGVATIGQNPSAQQSNVVQSFLGGFINGLGLNEE